MEGPTPSESEEPTSSVSVRRAGHVGAPATGHGPPWEREIRGKPLDDGENLNWNLIREPLGRDGLKEEAMVTVGE
jgi:hypothetical protein